MFKLEDLLKSNNYDTVALQNMKIYMEQKLNLDDIYLNNLTPYAQIEETMNVLRLGFKAYLFKNKVHEEITERHAVPETWKDAWKIEHMHKLPVFIQSRMTQPKYTYLDKTVIHNHVCPHIQNETKSTHISFMITDDEKDHHEVGVWRNRIEDIKKELITYHPLYNEPNGSTPESKKLLDEMVELDFKLKHRGFFDGI